MSEISVYNMEKKKVGTLPVPESLAGKPNLFLIHQVVVAQQLNRRQGNAKVKNRHEVSGSTRKIYRQKGTGGARHGDIKAPLFVGGGRAFGPKPRDYEARPPQKIRQRALREAILDRHNAGKLVVLSELNFETPKTKKAAKLFSLFNIKNALVVLDQDMVAAEKSIRNLERFKACRLEALTVLNILRHEHLVMTRGSYEKLASQLLVGGTK